MINFVEKDNLSLEPIENTNIPIHMNHSVFKKDNIKMLIF